MILSFINIRETPQELLKTWGFALRFQHFPRDLANVNELKIMFDPSTETFQGFLKVKSRQTVKTQFRLLLPGSALFAIQSSSFVGITA